MLRFVLCSDPNLISNSDDELRETHQSVESLYCDAAVHVTVIRLVEDAMLASQAVTTPPAILEALG